MSFLFIMNRACILLLIWIISVNDAARGEYLGCWKDNYNFEAMEHYAGREFGVDTCIAYCRGKDYPYAGISFAYHCFCGDQYAKFGLADETDCDLNCIVGPGICGGIDNLSVWAVNNGTSTADPEPVPTADPTNTPTTHDTLKPSPAPNLELSTKPTTPPTTTPTLDPRNKTTPEPTTVATMSQTEASFREEHEYMGCYVDGPNPAMRYSTGYKFGIRHCITFCKFRGYKYAGLRYFDQCSCGDTYARYGPAADSECNSNCQYGGGMCGEFCIVRAVAFQRISSALLLLSRWFCSSFKVAGGVSVFGKPRHYQQHHVPH
jgi:WSC domain